MQREYSERIFFSIGEVSKMVGLPPHVLRYWEEEFPSLKPAKARNGKRTYRPQDIEKIEQIKSLLRTEGYTIEGARRRLDQGWQGTTSQCQEVPPHVIIEEIEAGLRKIIQRLEKPF